MVIGTIFLETTLLLAVVGLEEPTVLGSLNGLRLPTFYGLAT